MPSPLHDELVALSARWLGRQGFELVATELTAVGCREQPDAIGFRSSCSAVVEVKVSRSDFLADRRKPERVDGVPGLGDYRFFMCPEGVILADDLPPRWGLLYARGKRVIDVVRPLGNLWSPPGTSVQAWADFQHEPCMRMERAMLFSIGRRLSSSQKL